MRFLCLLVIAILSGCNAEVDELSKYGNLTTYKINFGELSQACVTCLRKLLKNGISTPLVELPPLDPLYFKTYTLKLDSDHARGSFSFSEIKIKDFSNFKFVPIEEGEECLKIDNPTEGDKQKVVSKGHNGQETYAAKPYADSVRLNIDLEADFDGNVNLMGFVPVFGVGHMSADVDMLITYSAIDEGTSGVKIPELNVCVKIDTFNLAFTGLQGDEYMSKLIGKQIREIILLAVNDEYKDYITASLGNLKDIINKVFGSDLTNAIILTFLKWTCAADEIY